VFSPPADGNKDVLQLQEDLEQEKADNKVEPEKKKKALEAIISDFNQQYGTNHRITEFDLYYQDIQQRIKMHRFSNADYAHKNKIDSVFVMDMSLTGFNRKSVITLYVETNLKYHGLFQAFTRTYRTLHSTGTHHTIKPHGNILDFRQQQTDV